MTLLNAIKYNYKVTILIKTNNTDLSQKSALSE